MFTVAESGLSKLKGSIYKNIDLSHRLRVIGTAGW